MILHTEALFRFSTHAAGEAAGANPQRTLVFYPMKCPNRCAT